MPDFLESIEQFLQSFSAEELAITREVFRRLLDRRPTRPETLAVTLDLPPSVVEAAVARLVERGTMTVDPETDELVGARGLSLKETPHRLAINGRQLYGFCAVDAVGIPAALELDARVESRCHACGTPLVLTLKKGAVTEAPPGTVVWATARDLTRPLHAYT